MYKQGPESFERIERKRVNRTQTGNRPEPKLERGEEEREENPLERRRSSS